MFRQRARRRRKFSRAEQIFLSLLLGFLLAAGVILLINIRLRPLVVEECLAVLTNQLGQSVNDAVAEAVENGAYTYSDLIQLTCNDAGEVVSLSANMVRLNLLRSQVVQSVADGLDEAGSWTMSVPLGNLSGSAMLSGRGPILNVKVLSVGNLSSYFDNNFISVGINQSRHQVVLCVETEIILMLPGGSVTKTVTTRVTVAETVLLGQVPNSYTYFSQFDTAEEAAGAYFDYGANQ